MTDADLQVITDAANLCASEANRWRTNSDPRTYLHWEQVAGLLRAQCVAAKVAVERMHEMEQKLAAVTREREALMDEKWRLVSLLDRRNHEYQTALARIAALTEAGDQMAITLDATGSPAAEGDADAWRIVSGGRP